MVSSSMPNTFSLIGMFWPCVRILLRISIAALRVCTGLLGAPGTSRTGGSPASSQSLNSPSSTSKGVRAFADFCVGGLGTSGGRAERGGVQGGTLLGSWCLALSPLYSACGGPLVTVILSGMLSAPALSEMAGAAFVDGLFFVTGLLASDDVILVLEIARSSERFELRFSGLCTCREA